MKEAGHAPTAILLAVRRAIRDKSSLPKDTLMVNGSLGALYVSSKIRRNNVVFTVLSAICWLTFSSYSL